MSSGVSVGFPDLSFTKYRFSSTVRAFCDSEAGEAGGVVGNGIFKSSRGDDWITTCQRMSCICPESGGLTSQKTSLSLTTGRWPILSCQTTSFSTLVQRELKVRARVFPRHNFVNYYITTSYKSDVTE